MDLQSNADAANAFVIKPTPSSDGFVEAGGLRLHYLDFGSPGRPPMLCVHGGAAHAHWFDFVASRFNSEYHVRALDLRGHGDSQWSQPADYSYQRFAKDIAEFVEKLDLRDFVLIGHSMGGMVSLVYAATYPGRAGRLVVVDSTLKITDARMAEWRGIGNRAGSSYDTLEDFIAGYRLRPPGSTPAPELVRHLARHAGRRFEDGHWRHKVDRDVYGTRQFVDGMAFWDRIKIPALLVKGARSQRITPELYAEAKARCPQLELIEVAQSHHHVVLDNPADFGQVVNSFLRKHSIAK